MFFRRGKILLLGLWLCIGLYAQDSLRLYADTLHAEDLVEHLSEDQLLLQLVAEQSRKIVWREDSLFQVRLATDTTTAFPFHVGLRDSLLIAERVKHMYGVHPLGRKLYYKSREWPSLTDSLPTEVNIQSVRNEARRYITAHHAELYVGMFDSIEYTDPALLRPQQCQLLDVPERSLIHDAEEERRERLRNLKNRFTLWRKELVTMAQMTQNYVSQNWYAGGNSNFALLTLVQGTLKYDNHKNLTWENSLEWRMGFNTVTGDSLRKVNTNDDLFRLYTKLGLKAFGKFSYSLSADFETQFFNTWKENTLELKTGPLTPIRLNVSLGLDYKPVKGLSIVIAPLTYKMVYAHDTLHVSQTAFGIDEGTRLLNDVGSSLRVDWSWKPVREIALDTKFYCYTNYHRVELDLEVTCNFIINRFISARVMLHPRYDNTIILPDDARARIQFKEMLSIGFAHKFR
ncbi:MAG: DUF3078 domain-containing protein [Paludibacter sp.]|nr:DUF3078 domain-containing protein [Bacteroidales bacterium]MCM1069875.1 DUF3078 domain-containing protein [Prevotella sp.]MCM1353052.1 DUF3078 domain-containing protein [Bacteroides sp.]MCM1443409.1 DUF3078 domain-containing protein [Muribaculum sp.]MCM1481217.1 DUF3078 domain-containing protein [Paludibacter sp.]